MSKVLCTFPGKFGDILWALPTARAVARITDDGRVDFAIMPDYESLLPLLAKQSYLDKVFVIPEWKRTNSDFGDQPWQHPSVGGYEHEFALGYHKHPDIPLARFTALQQGIILADDFTPFITASDTAVKPSICVGFNNDDVRTKQVFLAELKTQIGEAQFFDLRGLSWLDAASYLSEAYCYVGDRSALAVLAYGLGKKVVSFEPDIWRSGFGQNAHTFGPGIIGAESPVHNAAEAASAIELLAVLR